MPTRNENVATAAAAGIEVVADVVHRPPNRIKIRIAFSGNSRECNVDLDSATGCKCSMSGPLYPEDMALVTAIMALVTGAKATYPPVS